MWRSRDLPLCGGAAPIRTGVGVGPIRLGMFPGAVARRFSHCHYGFVKGDHDNVSRSLSRRFNRCDFGPPLPGLAPQITPAPCTQRRLLTELDATGVVAISPQKAKSMASNSTKQQQTGEGRRGCRPPSIPALVRGIRGRRSILQATGAPTPPGARTYRR